MVAEAFFDSQSQRYKTPFGAVKAGEEFRLRLRLPPEPGDPKALVLFYRDGEQQPGAVFAMESIGWEEDGAFWEARCQVPEPGLYFYHFEATVEGRRQVVCRDPASSRSAGQAGVLWQLTVYDPALSTPPVLGRGVLYQIFPDRFCASGRPHPVPEGRRLREDWGGVPQYLPDPDGQFRCNDYFRGDLEGIRQKLPYLQSLGVTCLYLNPIFEAHSNHRYNTADYRSVDPMLGTEEDFARLCAEGKERGIAVILDGVFSHTGSDSLYFNREGRYGEGGAARDPNSPYRPWYNFHPWPDSYDCWWGFQTLPNVNEWEYSYRQFICGEEGVLAKWLDLGASGFRLDVADELPDLFLDQLRRAVKGKNPQAAIIGEVWEDASNKSSYGHRRRYLLGEQLDSVMNYPFRQAILDYFRWGDGELFGRRILSVLENYPRPVVDGLMNSLSTHDVERAITALAGEDCGSHDRRWQGEHHFPTPGQYARGKAMLAAASLVQYTLPGIPCLYYGDEAGLWGYKDPLNRGCYPWGEEDAQLVEVFRRLGALRQEPALAGGDFSLLAAGDQCLVYERTVPGQTLLVAVSRREEPVSPPIPPAFQGLRPLLTLGDFREGKLAPYGGVVFSLRPSEA